MSPLRALRHHRCRRWAQRRRAAELAGRRPTGPSLHQLEVVTVDRATGRITVYGQLRSTR